MKKTMIVSKLGKLNLSDEDLQSLKRSTKVAYQDQDFVHPKASASLAFSIASFGSGSNNKRCSFAT
jgi:hypothetical protein